MELQEFVAQTLVQIVQGVKDAQAQLGDERNTVNPPQNMTVETLAKAGLMHSSVAGFTQLVSFDISVEARSGTGTKGAIGVAMGVIGMGSSGQSNHE